MRQKSKSRQTYRRLFAGLLVVFICLIAVGFYFYRSYGVNVERSAMVMSWLRNPSANPEWAVTAGQRCGTAPFLIPSDGFIGFIWDDSFRIGHRHQGIDIFGGTEVNQSPVVAAYTGFLTRLPEWKSTVIIRIPDDPLLPGRQIWTYYTHLAGPQGESYISDQFPPGTYEKFVEAGELLGYQGNYSGTAGNPVGVHLHFSIVIDDGQGHFLNELEIENTLDPSPYLGIPLNANHEVSSAPVCPQ